ncbi:MAG: riboflavin synthase [Candidatus Omnitrophica bacterium]|nr:riboflavin synthase [Candidatus Omnitrophota bacterium]
MFSGIVEELGSVKTISRRGVVTLLEVSAAEALDGTVVGDSIAVNGTCLTVVGIDKGTLSFEVIQQTLTATNLGELHTGSKVNLERSLRVGERISGHFVTGHVDCIGIIRQKKHVSSNLCVEVAVPHRYLGFIVPQGSVSLDGISLTVVYKKGNTFGVYIIPHTLEHTTLKFKGPSEKVNVEFDVLTKKNS